MNIIGVIPARFKSTRFPGKPLADLCGKPMIWWTYEAARRANDLSQLVVATDDDRIIETCQLYKIPTIMTAENHPNHINRVWEVSEKIEGDLYVCINGDEPLTSPENIKSVIPDYYDQTSLYFGGLMRVLNNPVEAMDFSNIKVVVNKNNECIYMSRALIPFPKGSITYNVKKFVGIECFNKIALDFFVNSDMGILEKIEDIDHLRFLENHAIMHMTEIETDSISVDSPSDLEKVKKILLGRN